MNGTKNRHRREEGSGHFQSQPVFVSVKDCREWKHPVSFRKSRKLELAQGWAFFEDFRHSQQSSTNKQVQNLVPTGVYKTPLQNEELPNFCSCMSPDFYRYCHSLSFNNFFRCTLPCPGQNVLFVDHTVPNMSLTNTVGLFTPESVCLTCRLKIGLCCTLHVISILTSDGD